jgi:predicted nucleic acid-binding protein
MKEDLESCLSRLVIVLDTGVLSLFTQPQANENSRNCTQKITNFLKRGVQVTSSLVCDYELRRELLRANRKRGIARLNHFRDTFGCIPITNDVMDKASELWAWSRNSGQSTASEDSLDADVILAAQIIILSQQSTKSYIVVTTNVKHIDRYTPAIHWQKATVQSCLNRCSFSVETTVLTLSIFKANLLFSLIAPPALVSSF